MLREIGGKFGRLNSEDNVEAIEKCEGRWTQIGTQIRGHMQSEVRYAYT